MSHGGCGYGGRGKGCGGCGDGKDGGRPGAITTLVPHSGACVCMNDMPSSRLSSSINSPTIGVMTGRTAAHSP